MDIGTPRDGLVDAPSDWPVAAETLPPAGALAGVSALSDGVLRTELADVFAQRRLLDARLVELAGEVVARSRTELGADGLARRSGHSTPAAMVASIGLTSTTDAARLCRVGTATAPRVALTGELLPPPPPVFPVLAAALSGGAVGVDAAIHIVRELDHTRPRAAVTDLDVAEQELVGFATAATADDVRRLAVSWKTALDPDGIEPREQALVARRSLRRVILPGGMTRYVIDLDPLSAAYLDTALDAETTATLRKVRFTRQDPAAAGAHGADTDPATGCTCPGEKHTGSCRQPDAPPDLGPDPRTIRQIGADVIVDLARHVLSCRDTTPALASATVIVRINHDTLTTGAGAVTIDGSEQPISVSTARRVAADAHIIPIVLGTQSQVLDLGRAARLFTPAQKLAITDRDGGCAAPGCTSPPTWTEVHHIKWWHRDSGPTNLSNGDPPLHERPPPGPHPELGHPDTRQHRLVHPTRHHRPEPHPHPRRTTTHTTPPTVNAMMASGSRVAA